jgi:hypothetical protein
MTEGALRDQFLDLAERYETVAALDLTATNPEPTRSKPGSRVPPGMQEVLDQDELRQCITAVDDLAAFLAHVLADELDVAASSPATPPRLRLAAEHAGHFIVSDDLPDTDDHGLLALGVQDDVAEALRNVRRLAGRTVRKVRTGHHCHAGCGGQYVSPLGTSGDRHEDSLRCEKCGHEVPHEVWSRWPRARVQYVTVDHAAKMLGITAGAVKMRAARGRWQRVGTGRDVRYSVDAVRASLDGGAA